MFHVRKAELDGMTVTNKASRLHRYVTANIKYPERLLLVEASLGPNFYAVYQYYQQSALILTNTVKVIRPHWYDGYIAIRTALRQPRDKPGAQSLSYVIVELEFYVYPKLW